MKAFVFDFDGLIIDTEAAEFEAWREVYAAHGAELTREVWANVVGSEQGSFDPVAHLERLTGRPVDRAAAVAYRRRRTLEIIEGLPVLPGVAAYIAEAQRRGMKLGVASNSSFEWVNGHLRRLGLADAFACVCCADHVQRGKPAPDVYLAATRCLGVAPEEAIALEDSPYGVRAARAAGLFCVAIPSTLTRGLDFSAAHLTVASLADLPVADLLAAAAAARHA